MEERDPKATEVASQMKSQYAPRFMSIQDTFHPAGIPGESAGKSSNVSWAAKGVVRKYADHANRKDVLVTIMDSMSSQSLLKILLTTQATLICWTSTSTSLETDIVRTDRQTHTSSTCLPWSSIETPISSPD